MSPAALPRAGLSPARWQGRRHRAPYPHALSIEATADAEYGRPRGVVKPSGSWLQSATPFRKSGHSKETS